MQCLYLLLSIALSQALEIKKEPIPVPDVKSLTAIEPHGFIVAWNPVKSSDAHNPVVGYKLKVWEEETIKIYASEIKDGVKTLVAKNEPASKGSFDYSNKIPERKPVAVVVIPGEDKTKAQFDDMKFNVKYEIRVLAFTNKEDGPLSEPMTLTLSANKSSHDKDVYAVS